MEGTTLVMMTVSMKVNHTRDTLYGLVHLCSFTPITQLSLSRTPIEQPGLGRYL